MKTVVNPEKNLVSIFFNGNQDKVLVCGIVIFFFSLWNGQPSCYLWKRFKVWGAGCLADLPFCSIVKLKPLLCFIPHEGDMPASILVNCNCLLKVALEFMQITIDCPSTKASSTTKQHVIPKSPILTVSDMPNTINHEKSFENPRLSLKCKCF